MKPEPSFDDWRRDNAQWLRLALRLLRARLHQHARRCACDAGRAADWLLAADAAEFDARAAIEPDGALAPLEAELAAHTAHMRERGARAPALPMLADLASMDTLESDLLLMAAAPALDGAFELAYAGVHGDARLTCATLHLALALHVDVPDVRLIAADCLMPNRPLRALRLLEVDDREGPLLTRRLRVDERVSDFLRGVNHLDARLCPLLAPLPATPESVAARAAGEQAARAVLADADRWATVNLIGQLERGAADAAAAACAALGLRPLLLDLARYASLSAAERTTMTTLMSREAVLVQLAVVVDGARATGHGEWSAAIDELIASLAGTLFVVSEERWQASGELITQRIPAPTRDEQRGLWRSALNGHGEAMQDTVERIVQQFDFGGAAIAQVAARTAAAHGDPSGDALTGDALWQACREHCGAALDEYARRLQPCYGWDDIVVSDAVRAQLRELASQVEARARVYEHWGFGAQLARGRGITALFAGQSGTGKTMAAEILAAHLRLDLYRIDLAGIVSKYIGETEKNLRRVFDAAERTGVILFFDEADALFGSRTDVRDSHDRYANLEINYLLQRMEDYAGLAILATNRRSALDPAFLRRLRFVIDFPFPNADERRHIWQRVFPPQAPVDGIELAFLSRLDLSGGNIRSIALNAAFLAASAGHPIDMPSIMRAAAREYAKLSKPAGGAEFGAYLDAAQAGARR
ncbi:ATP-binding protein [Paraburkholderia youngii]|uniref:ATP-binding protein n=1 Tax=Paraburkholderia youngii TaxID=2782701 RepID=UPI003D217C1F